MTSFHERHRHYELAEKQRNTRQMNRTRTINVVVLFGLTIAAIFTLMYMMGKDDARWAKAEAVFQYQQCLADGGTWVRHMDTGEVSCDKGDRYGYKN